MTGITIPLYLKRWASRVSTNPRSRDVWVAMQILTIHLVSTCPSALPRTITTNTNLDHTSAGNALQLTPVVNPPSPTSAQRSDQASQPDAPCQRSLRHEQNPPRSHSRVTPPDTTFDRQVTSRCFEIAPLRCKRGKAQLVLASVRHRRLHAHQTKTNNSLRKPNLPTLDSIRSSLCYSGAVYACRLCDRNESGIYSEFQDADIRPQASGRNG